MMSSSFQPPSHVITTSDPLPHLDDEVICGCLLYSDKQVFYLHNAMNPSVFTSPPNTIPTLQTYDQTDKRFEKKKFYHNLKSSNFSFM